MVSWIRRVQEGTDMTPLIDATEMYLRTIWELEEEGITPIRARLVERLNLSAPAVSETVARLEHEELLHIAGDRRLELTELGRRLAVGVMRKHRLAERLLTDIIGLDWEHVHTEACRWEHVISDRVEERLVQLLEDPDTCPHGNPIPGHEGSVGRAELQTMVEAAKNGRTATVRRISEKLQGDVEAMRKLRDAGIRPGVQVALAIEEGDVRIDVGGTVVRLADQDAELVYVAP
jgi:DtxR family Mn-dependent transcriptional regulator